VRHVIPRVTPAQIDRLRVKYRLLLQLRETRDAAIIEGFTEFPEDEQRPRRTTMKALAAEFPGALRELDDTSLEEVRERLVELDAGVVSPWMEAVSLFHWALREALALRREPGASCSFWSGEALGTVRAPPTGRLLDVVWTAVAAELNVTPGAAERLVYPRAPGRGIRQ
jgi:hypothetical protein